VILCHTLGPIEVTLDGGPAPADLLWRKNLALLIYLARSPRRTRSRDHLVGLLWGDRSETAARHSLSEALRVIRRHIGEASVETSGGQVRLAPGVVEVDVEHLEQLAEAEEWEQAAELIAGEFLEGFSVPGASEFEDWLGAEREVWRRRGVDVLVRGADAFAQSGRTQDASALASRALSLDPVSERALGASLRCFSLLGDRSGALELYDRFAARLKEEVGSTPSEETLALVERIRRERSLRRETGSDWAGGDAAVRVPFEGRAGELGRLLQAVNRSAAERAATVLILEGESGVGKTRLLEELLARLRLDGFSIATARAVEADREEPWSGLLAVARGGLAEAGGIGAASPEALGAFAEAVPAWRERFPGARTESPFPIGRAIVEALRVAAEERPVVISLDDAQWLDRETANELGAIMRDLSATRLTLLLALVPHPKRPELDELRSRIGRDLAGEAVRLRPLDRAALRRLAERMLPGYERVAIDRVTRRVATDSAGMPLLAVELLRAVALGLDLGTISEAWPEPMRTLDQTLPGELPDAVVAAIRIGFRRLSPSAQRVLAAASVLGDLVPTALLEKALAVGPEEINLALDELEWHRWVVAEPRGYSFVARLVQRVVERDMLTPGQRRRVLEAVGRPEPGA
jgi:DNA-binding SARP family transcriptional activator